MQQRTIFKDGKIYIYASKVEKFNRPYSISPQDKAEIDEKLEKNMRYLNDTWILTNSRSNNKLRHQKDESAAQQGVQIQEYMTMYDVSMGANITPKKYHAELYNRILTLKEYAKDQRFDMPVFITITPPSHLKPLKQIKITSTLYKLIDNPKFNGDPDYAIKGREYIGNIWRKFTNHQIFKDIKRQFGTKLIFLKVYEPFLDGAPHSHIICFIPSSFKERFIRAFNSCIGKTKTDVKTEFNGDIGGVIAYIFKYILKSFIHKDKKCFIDDVAYWYIKFNMRRFSTSRTLIPLTYYRRIKSDKRFRNMLEMTKVYKNDMLEITCIANLYKSLQGEKLLSADLKLYEIAVNVVDDDGFLTSVKAYKRSDKITIIFANGEQKIIDEYSVSKSDLIDKTKGVIEFNEKIEHELPKQDEIQKEQITEVFNLLFKESIKRLPDELKPDEIVERLLEQVFQQNALKALQMQREEELKGNKKRLNKALNKGTPFNGVEALLDEI